MPRSNVRRLKRWQRVLAGDGASAIVGIDHCEPEGSLPEARNDDLWLPEAGPVDRFGDPLGLLLSTLKAPLPQLPPILRVKVNSGARQVLWIEARGDRDQIIRLEERAFGNSNATDRV